MSKVFIKVTSIDFGEVADRRDAKYYFMVVNNRTNNSSSHFFFEYGNSRNINLSFCMNLYEYENQSFTIKMYKYGFIRDDPIGSCKIFVNSFPLNCVCHDSFELSKKNSPRKTPVIVYIDVHVDVNNSAPFKAPETKSYAKPLAIDSGNIPAFIDTGINNNDN